MDAARAQASEVKDHAVDAGGGVVETAKQAAGDVAEEAKAQAKDVWRQTQDELRAQAEVQQRRVAEGLHSVSRQFSRMAEQSPDDGVATDLGRRAATRTGSVASWLDRRDPGSLVDEVRRYAGRKPGTFIAIAAAAGLLAGRLTRSVAGSTAEQTDDGGAR
jgi:ElaB/YqjD/DUF883 family membrane-anchored ribosome-binding protein